MRHKHGQGLVWQQIERTITIGIDMPKLLKQYKEIFRTQARQPNDRAGEVQQPGLREAVLGQAGLQCRVTVQTTPSIHQEFWRPAKNKPKPFSSPLQRVIEDAQDLLVIGIARLRI
ncbi:hypothetical protein D3C75_1092850 [compost metagenome]